MDKHAKTQLANRIADHLVPDSASPSVTPIQRQAYWHLAQRAALAGITETHQELCRSLREDFDDWPDYVTLTDVADSLENPWDTD